MIYRWTSCVWKDRSFRGLREPALPTPCWASRKRILSAPWRKKPTTSLPWGHAPVSAVSGRTRKRKRPACSSINTTIGGFLEKNTASGSGLPVINLPGCPCHSDVLAGTLSALANDMRLELNKFHSPLDWYRIMVHQGCTRNEYHEYRVEEKQFGEKGCLFFYMGCQGPLVTGPCNKILWNRRSSKTRVGVPCFGCTHMDFPQQYPFFKTRNIEGIPIELPAGVSRAHYMAYKGMAAAAAPKRLIKRKSGI